MIINITFKYRNVILYLVEENTTFEPPEWESQLHEATYTAIRERTYIDKILNREDAKRLQELMKKENLERSDLLEILYLLAGVEIKLVNFGDYDRYLLGKFFAWIRDFISKTELVYDYIEIIEGMIREEKNKKDRDERIIKELEEIKEILEKVKKYDLHNAKFLVDVYLYLSRSTLSLGATGFDTLTTSKFEYHYPIQKEAIGQPERRFWFFGRR